MPIARPIDDLPRPSPAGAPLRSGTALAHQIADKWWKQYQESPDFERASAMPELPLRASMIGKRCDRALWYMLTDTPMSNPPGAAGVWRMRMGKLIHDEIETLIAHNRFDDDNNKHGWWSEEVTDLSVIGYPGSSHADLIYYHHGVATMINETKSLGGFAFKLATTTFKGEPQGAKWQDVMQAAIVAVARDVAMIVALYISPEAISPDVAERNGLDEYGKFIAEWQFNTADWAQDVYTEIARQNRILKLATPYEHEGREITWIPERSIDHPDYPGGALIDNPAKGHWVTLNPATGDVVKSGTAWFCGYCNHRDQCLLDGPESVAVVVVKKPVAEKPLTTAEMES